MSVVDEALFKRGMRCLAAGVCVVTSRDGEGLPVGMTATAVCSVSAAPPTLLVCVNRRHASYAVFRRAGRFAVNVLALEDRALSTVFAGDVPAGQRFDHGRWTTLATGAPVLDSALASFDCTLAEVTDMGSHGVFFGEVRDVCYRREAAAPLLYGLGAYGTLSAV